MIRLLNRAQIQSKGPFLGKQPLPSIVSSLLHPNSSCKSLNYGFFVPIQQQAVRFRNTRVKTEVDREQNRARHAPGPPKGPAQLPKYTPEEREEKNRLLAAKENLMPYKTHGSRAKQLRARKKKPVNLDFDF
jgi:hypothetical protein